jgi:hypothetical protein
MQQTDCLKNRTKHSLLAGDKGYLHGNQMGIDLSIKFPYLELPLNTIS